MVDELPVLYQVGEYERRGHREGLMGRRGDIGRKREAADVLASQCGPLSWKYQASLSGRFAYVEIWVSAKVEESCRAGSRCCRSRPGCISEEGVAVLGNSLSPPCPEPSACPEIMLIVREETSPFPQPAVLSCGPRLFSLISPRCQPERGNTHSEPEFPEALQSVVCHLGALVPDRKSPNRYVPIGSDSGRHRSGRVPLPSDARRRLDPETKPRPEK